MPGLIAQSNYSLPLMLLKASNVIAVDAEFTLVRSAIQTNVSTTSQRLALLQLAIDKQCFVVDALRLHDLSPLAAVVADPSIIILLHGAGSDSACNGRTRSKCCSLL